MADQREPRDDHPICLSIRYPRHPRKALRADDDPLRIRRPWRAIAPRSRQRCRHSCVPISSVELHPRNPRVGDVEAVAASLRRFGQQKPIVVQGVDRIRRRREPRPPGRAVARLDRYRRERRRARRRDGDRLHARRQPDLRPRRLRRRAPRGDPRRAGSRRQPRRDRVRRRRRGGARRRGRARRDPRPRRLPGPPRRHRRLRPARRPLRARPPSAARRRRDPSRRRRRACSAARRSTCS